MNQNYDASDIEVLVGLDPIKKRPGMYTDTSHPNHLIHEVVDNSVDEAISGYANKIEIILHTDGSISVSDNGRGMPVDEHPEEKISGIELVFTRLHAGGKFSNKTYQFSGGLHGVGISVVNALSSILNVYVRRDGKEHHMSFVAGNVGSPLLAIRDVGKKNTGTTIRFRPDAQYFDTTDISIPPLKHVLRAKAILCPGLKISWLNEINEEKIDWVYADGLKAYLTEKMTDHAVLPSEPFFLSMHSEGKAVECALYWVLDGAPMITESYVNLVPTVHGGTHVNGFKQGLLDAVREFCSFRNLLPRGIKLIGEDVAGLCSFILSVKLKDPQFLGQIKERLASREAHVFVAAIVRDSLSDWLHQHIDSGELLVEHILECAQARLKASHKIARKKVSGGPALPGKLTDCLVQDMRAELFLVEGDSAGGSAKQARNRNFQAVMPLRGKILNTWEVDASQVLLSKEVHDISVAIGVDPNSENLDGLRYGKICMLADADSDGAHIATLLCGLFVKHFRPLVEQGHIYIAMPPLYRIDIGKEVFYALDEPEKQQILDRIAGEKKKRNVNVQRFKGLGEMNPIQLRETTMAPEKRRLIQLVLPNIENAEEIVDMLLSKKRAPDRKKWIESAGDMSKI